MDILDILLDILLKPPQPFIGLFFTPLCDCVHIEVCMARGHAWQGGHVWKEGVCMAGGMHGRGLHGRRACMAGGGCVWQRGHTWQVACMVGVCMAVEMATAADGTHPT